MGFFSWITQDTNQSIANKYSERATFSVTMTDNKGNRQTEEDYEGYGEFAGKDYYELLAEMNGLEGRDAGIDLFFFKKDDQSVLSPNLTEDKNWVWRNSSPKECPDQGFFYPFDEEDE